MLKSLVNARVLITDFSIPDKFVSITIQLFSNLQVLLDVVSHFFDHVDAQVALGQRFRQPKDSMISALIKFKGC